MQTIATEQLRSSSSRSRGSGPARSAALALASRFIAVLVVAVLFAAVLEHSQRRLATTAVAAAENAVPVYLPDAKFLRMIALGYENVLADVLWFRTIDYFGRHFHSDRFYPWLARMCDLVTDLDPRAQHVYRFGGLLLPWEANRPDEGIALLQKGLEVFPESWNLHFILGFNYFFFKSDVEKALPHVRRAAELPGAHPFVSRFAALLYAEKSGPDTAREFLRELEGTADDQMRAVIRQRLLEIELGERLARLESAIAGYRQRHGRNPAELDDLVSSGTLESIGADPFGNPYRYDPDTGTVASSRGHRPLRLYVSPNRERLLRGKSLEE